MQSTLGLSGEFRTVCGEAEVNTAERNDLVSEQGSDMG